MGDKNGMNKCVNCGRELPEGAAFCPYCETVQAPKLEVEAPKPRGRREKIPAPICLMKPARSRYS